jgi:hypothetical protein
MGEQLVIGCEQQKDCRHVGDKTNHSFVYCNSGLSSCGSGRRMTCSKQPSSDLNETATCETEGKCKRGMLWHAV